MNLKFTSIQILALITLLFTLPASGNSRDAWHRIDNARVVSKGIRYIQPVRYISFALDKSALLQEFSSAEVLTSGNSRTSGTVISIPMPDGSFQEFSMFRSEVMHPGLAARYPFITTYAAQGITDPSATAVFDFTQFGFHGMILSPNGTVFIDPYSMDDNDHYMVYYKKDFVTNKQFECLVEEGTPLTELNRIPDMAPGLAKTVGNELKTYRLAMAATGEYTAFYGGTVAGALAGIVTSVNRVTGVYEREFSIRMTLIPNTDLLIYTNATTDPYTNSNGGTMLGQNQTNITNVIGGGNYDIGHVFSTGGGGIAGLGVVCNFSQKARGVTGSSQPVNDPFDIDYVAHEIGHQYGGNHTFNCEVSACAGNRAFNAAYEPGSGSTIMAYAGICGNNNLQSNSDDYFHTKSFDEIIIYTTSGVGGNCPVVTQTGNTPPVINPGANYVIPYLTPFRLTGDATDPDGDPLTYCWEQYDLGPAGTWNNPSGNAPIFRSFDPSISPTRLFPKLTNILNNNQTIGEVKPSYARTLNFKLTVRDNRLNGGGVTNNDTPLQQVQVINTGQAFAVTSPNVTGIVWNAGGMETVTWDVGGSDLAPISTPLVNILLSTDGGQTFPVVLASQVPNNGTYTVNVPNTLTTTARVMVEGEGNIFFDINDKNFEIGTVGMNEVQTLAGVMLYPNPASGQLHITLDESVIIPDRGLELLIVDVTGRIIMKNQVDSRSTIADVSKIARGIYNYRITGANGIAAAGRVVLQ